MEPRIAFVVATKDRPEELRRLWRSLLLQSRVPDQVVVVDASARPSPPLEREGGRPVLSSIRSAVASASRRPCRPVQALALPLFSTMAEKRPPRRCLFDT